MLHILGGLGPTAIAISNYKVTAWRPAITYSNAAIRNFTHDRYACHNK